MVEAFLELPLVFQVAFTGYLVLLLMWVGLTIEIECYYWAKKRKKKNEARY